MAPFNKTKGQEVFLALLIFVLFSYHLNDTPFLCPFQPNIYKINIITIKMTAGHPKIKEKRIEINDNSISIP